MYICMCLLVYTDIYIYTHMHERTARCYCFHQVHLMQSETVQLWVPNAISFVTANGFWEVRWVSVPSGGQPSLTKSGLLDQCPYQHLNPISDDVVFLTTPPKGFHLSDQTQRIWGSIHQHAGLVPWAGASPWTLQGVACRLIGPENYNSYCPYFWYILRPSF